MLKKITYINAFVAACIPTVGFIWLHLSDPQSLTKPKQIAVAVLISVVFVGLAVLLTQLIGRAIIGELWASRLVVVLSVLWFLICIVFIEPLEYNYRFHTHPNISNFVIASLMPLTIIWGLIWVLRATVKSKDA